MTIKEKLELLWKYLLLAVLVYGFFELGHHQPFGPWPHPKMHGPMHQMKWISDDDLDLDDMDVDVQVQKSAAGDSIFTVTINGLKYVDDRHEHQMKVIKKEQRDSD